MRKPFVLLLALLALGAVCSLPAFAATKTVGIFDDHFSPKSVSVKKNAKVVWRWRSGFHNVTVTKGPAKFHSADKSGGSYSHKFTRRGTYSIECTIHGFRMKVKVS